MCPFGPTPSAPWWVPEDLWASLLIVEPSVLCVPHGNAHKTKSLSCLHTPAQNRGHRHQKEKCRQDLTGKQNRFPSLRGLRTAFTDFPFETLVFMSVFNYFDVCWRNTAEHKQARKIMSVFVFLTKCDRGANDEQDSAWTFN